MSPVSLYLCVLVLSVLLFTHILQIDTIYNLQGKVKENSIMFISRACTWHCISLAPQQAWSLSNDRLVEKIKGQTERLLPPLLVNYIHTKNANIHLFSFELDIVFGVMLKQYLLQNFYRRSHISQFCSSNLSLLPFLKVLPKSDPQCTTGKTSAWCST